MIFNSLFYLFIFLPLVMLIYQISPNKHKGKVLLFASYLFFFLISEKMLIYLIISTFSIYFIGLKLSEYKKRYNDEKKSAKDKKALKAHYTKWRRALLLLGIILNLGILLFLKYNAFFSLNINYALHSISAPFRISSFSLGVPIGISFYTLQAISYLSDVYEGRIEADHNWGRLALYLSFFPIIIEGPICRYSQIAEQTYKGKPLEYKNITFGIQRMLWGLIKKVILADRLNVLVTKVFNDYSQYSGITIIVAAIFYTYQLYMDFSGCIDITIGMGEIFGIIIPENFKQPFFSKTASEFWRRWHITLGTWFKDYIFYPISLTKPIKDLGKFTRAKFGKHFGQLIPSSIALFFVWLSNGIWHGVGWNYIFFGMYYFALILTGNILEPYIQKFADFIKISRCGLPYRFFQTVKMLVIIFTGELFFRANGLKAGLKMFISIFKGFDINVLTNGLLLQLGLSIQDFYVLAIGFVVVLAVGIIHEKGISIREKIAGHNVFLRWSIYYAAIIAIIVLGAYGTGYLQAEIIYAAF